MLSPQLNNSTNVPIATYHKNYNKVKTLILSFSVSIEREVKITT